VIIWLNGAFGAGKTTTARRLVGRLEGIRHFDPELVGYLLRATSDDHEFTDFQDLVPWRELVPVFTERIAACTGQHLIALQTVLREGYWRELTAGFEGGAGDLPRAPARGRGRPCRAHQGGRGRGRRLPVAPRPHRCLRAVPPLDAVSG
jgi:hypothetical protein